MAEVILISTRKGLIVAEKDAYKGWKISASHFDSIPVTFTYEDPRNGYWWVGLDHGHWGIKLHLSKDKGKTWTRIQAPAFNHDEEVKPGVKASTSYIWSIHHGGNHHPEDMYIGTIPGALFQSNDYGNSWQINRGLWDHESRIEHWFGAGFDHPGIHSICLDPRDSNSMQVGISCAGVFESTDNGSNWRHRNKGLIAEFLPDKSAEYGHDPHILERSISNPDVLWQQNHCGIFKSTNNGGNWLLVSEEGGPANFGFALAIADDNHDEVWVAPAIADEQRIALNKSLCISKTTDGGQTWEAKRKGLPQGNVYDIVYRHGLATKGDTVVFGTTTGNVFFSSDRGEEWQLLSNYLPMVHAITFGSS